MSKRRRITIQESSSGSSDDESFGNEHETAEEPEDGGGGGDNHAPEPHRTSRLCHLEDHRETTGSVVPNQPKPPRRRIVIRESSSGSSSGESFVGDDDDSEIHPGFSSSDEVLLGYDDLEVEYDDEEQQQQQQQEPQEPEAPEVQRPPAAVRKCSVCRMEREESVYFSGEGPGTTSCHRCLGALSGLEFFHSTVYDTTATLPKEEGHEGHTDEAQWEADRPAVFRLLRHGLSIYDFEKFSGRYRNLPPVEELVGDYDVVFVRWKTTGVGDMCDVHGLPNGGLMRSIGGTLTLTHDGRPGEHQGLKGSLHFPEGPRLPAFQNRDQTGASLPFGHRACFRFSNGNATVGTTCLTSECDGDCVAFIHDGKALVNNDELYARVLNDEIFTEWGGDGSCKAELRAFCGPQSLEWTPRECYGANHPYAKRLREAMDRPPDWSDSWLHRRRSLPKPIVGLIHEYASFRSLLKPRLAIQPNDVQVTLDFVCAFSSGTLTADVIARKRA